METKKELKVADFISLSIIYSAINTSLYEINIGLAGEYEDEFNNDLTEIYELVTSAVTLKDGSMPENWEKVNISDCVIAMSQQTLNEIDEKISAFNEKTKKNYHLYDYDEKVIVHEMNEPNIENAIECLMYSLVEI